jgi:hypothetical protein
MSINEAIFEAPLSHEASGESSYEGDGESAYESTSGTAEWESYETGHSGEAAYGEASYEDEFGASYEGVFEDEWSGEADPFLGNVLGAITGALGLSELGLGETSFEMGQFETEWEGSYEADPFFGGALKLLKQAATKVLPVARKLAPGLMKTVGSMVPGGGGMMAMLSRLLREAEGEVQSYEASLFGQGESWEVGNTEAAHEAALAEVLAAEAVTATSEAEAVARIAAGLPITITISGARGAVRPVLPALTQANAHLVRRLRRSGPSGRQLLRLLPAINRRAAVVLRNAARDGRPVTTPLAVRALAASTRHVLGNPRVAGPALVRNGMIRMQSAPPRPGTPVFRPSFAAGSSARSAWPAPARVRPGRVN